jgi:hypothetical protein
MECEFVFRYHIYSGAVYNQFLLWLALRGPPTVIELSRFVLVNIPQNKCEKFTLPLVEQKKGLVSDAKILGL